MCVGPLGMVIIYTLSASTKIIDVYVKKKWSFLNEEKKNSKIKSCRMMRTKLSICNFEILNLCARCAPHATSLVPTCTTS